MKNKKATFAIFKNRTEIRTAIRSLLKLGFKDRDLAVMQPNFGAKDFPQVQKNQVLNGAMLGAVIGAFIAGCLYLFIGPGVDSHAVGVDGSVMRATMMGFFSLLVGAVAGAACGALVGVGTPDPVGKRYGQYMHAGGILLSVESDNDVQAARAENILMASGGQDVHVANEKSTWDQAIKENIHETNDRSKNIVDAYS